MLLDFKKVALLMMCILSSNFSQAQSEELVGSNRVKGIEIESGLQGEMIDPMRHTLSWSTSDINIVVGDINLGIARTSSGGAGNTLANWGFDLPRIRVSANAAGHVVGNRSDGGLGICHEPYAPEQFKYRLWSGVVFSGHGQQTQVFVERDVSASGFSYGKWVSNNNWVASCVTDSVGDRGFRVESPEGIAYFLTIQEQHEGHILVSPGEVIVWPSEIRDQHGNWIKFEYTSVSVPNTYSPEYVDTTLRVPSRIHTSDGQEVLFDTVPGKPSLVSKMTYSGKEWLYNYEYVSQDWQTDEVKALMLTSVDLPDGTDWQYLYTSHFGRDSNADYAPRGGLVRGWYMKSGQEKYIRNNWDFDGDALSGGQLTAYKTFLRGVDSPTGLVVRYGYESTATDLRGTGWGDNQLISIISKTVYGTAGLPAEGYRWDYSYIYESNNEFVRSTVETPIGTTIISKFHYYEDDDEPNLWKAHLPLSVQHLNQAGIQSQLSNYTYTNLGQIGGYIATFRGRSIHFENRARLSQMSVNRGGETFTTQYSNFDDYGFARTITETGNKTRVKRLTFDHSSSQNNWLIGNVATEAIDGIAGNTSRTFDNKGQLLTESNYGVTQTYTYHANGDLATSKDANNNITTYSNYKLGQPQLIDYPEGLEQSSSINGDRTVAWTEDAAGFRTTFGYDNLFRVNSITTPSTSDSNISINWQFDPNKKTETRGSLVTVTEYDALGRRTSESVGGVRRSYSYDAVNRLIHTSDPHEDTASGRASASSGGIQNTYDALDRLIETKNLNDSSRVQTSYGTNYSTIVTDAENNVTTYLYDYYGSPATKYLAKVTAPEGQITTITSNKLGIVQDVTQDGITLDYGYNVRWQVTSETRPETGTTTYGRDLMGNMTSKKVGTSATTAYSYDDLNRMTNINYPAGTEDVQYLFDNRGNLDMLVRGITTWDYDYDANGNLVNETLSFSDTNSSYAIDYGYNGLDNLSSITYPTNETVTFSPDVLGRPTKVGTYATGVGYHPNGLWSSFSYGNGLVADRTLTARQYPKNLMVDNGAVLDLMYGYDANSNVSFIDDLNDTNQNQTLAYDGLNRLDTAAGGWGSGSFTYDALGNIQTKTLGSQSLTYTYSSSTNLLSSVSGGASRTFSYDVYGNVSANGQDSFAYDDSSNLVTVNGTEESYLYDGHNRRARISENGNISRYSLYNQGGQLLFEYEPITGVATSYYFLGNDLVARRDGALTPAN